VHIVDLLVTNLMRRALSLVGDISAGVIVSVYTFFIFLFIIGSYINAYYIDKYKYYEVRKIIKLKIFRFLFKQYGKVNEDEIAKETFLNELLCILLIIVSLASMVISFFINDSIKVLLFIICLLPTFIIAFYLARKERKLRQNKSGLN